MKRVSLFILDLLMIVTSGIISIFLVCGSIHQISILNILIPALTYVFILALSKFYRFRITDSSLSLFRIAAISIALPSVAFVIFFGYFYGFASVYFREMILYSVFSFLVVAGSRLFFRIISEISSHRNLNLPSAIIYGAGELGSTMARMANKGRFQYDIKGFIDDNKGLQQEIVMGYPVFGDYTKIDEILQNNPVDTLIIAITGLSSDKIQTAVDSSIKHGIKTKIVPNLFETKGRADISVRDIDYADLLGRQLITIEKEPLFQMLSGKVVLVTGAGGSIGSEICKQLMEYGLSKLILIDIDETELHDLSLRLLNYSREWSDNVIPVVCDIKNSAKIEEIFEVYKPDIVFHAAAYKHVPLMELYPEEAINTNIGGSFNVFNSSSKNNVEKVVVISTDKAVNPTNVMGTTKRIVEMMAATFNEESENTDFCCVRFGNVIGSRGSMLPLFMEEIKAGKPITVTDRNIIRYFMAIPEAVGLVFRAATLANGGEVMVLDMGEPVKIYDFAQRLVDVFGDGRSTIRVTGLRPGEKLYEELLANKDTTIPTANEKIFKAKVNNVNQFTVNSLQKTVKDLQKYNKKQLMAFLHENVPEFLPPPRASRDK